MDGATLADAIHNRGINMRYLGNFWLPSQLKYFNGFLWVSSCSYGSLLTDKQKTVFLGKITSMLGKVPQLEYVHTIAACELVMRSAKHIFTVYLQHLDMLR